MDRAYKVCIFCILFSFVSQSPFLFPPPLLTQHCNRDESPQAVLLSKGHMYRTSIPWERAALLEFVTNPPSGESIPPPPPPPPTGTSWFIMSHVVPKQGQQASMLIVAVLGMGVVAMAIRNRNKPGIPGDLFREPTGRPTGGKKYN